MDKFEKALAICTAHERVCPKPKYWNALYNLIIENTNDVRPSLPLILAAWHGAPNLWKMLRLKEHLEFANNHNELDAAIAFLNELPENHWHHLYD